MTSTDTRFVDLPIAFDPGLSREIHALSVISQHRAAGRVEALGQDADARCAPRRRGNHHPASGGIAQVQSVPGCPRCRRRAGFALAPASQAEPAVRPGRRPQTRTKVRRTISPTRSFPLPGFANLEDLVHPHIRQLLHLFAGPTDLNTVHGRGFAQPEMQAPIALR